MSAYLQVNAIQRDVAYPEFVFDDAELYTRSKPVSILYNVVDALVVITASLITIVYIPLLRLFRQGEDILKL